MPVQLNLLSVCEVIKSAGKASVNAYCFLPTGNAPSFEERGNVQTWLSHWSSSPRWGSQQLPELARACPSAAWMNGCWSGSVREAAVIRTTTNTDERFGRRIVSCCRKPCHPIFPSSLILHLTSCTCCPHPPPTTLHPSPLPLYPHMLSMSMVIRLLLSEFNV